MGVLLVLCYLCLVVSISNQIRQETDALSTGALQSGQWIDCSNSMGKKNRWQWWSSLRPTTAQKGDRLWAWWDKGRKGEFIRSQREELWALGRVTPIEGKRLTHGEQVKRKTRECTLDLTLLLPSHPCQCHPLGQPNWRPEERQLGVAIHHSQPQREDTEQKGDGRRVDLEGNMENIQHCIQMEI